MDWKELLRPTKLKVLSFFIILLLEFLLLNVYHIFGLVETHPCCREFGSTGRLTDYCYENLDLTPEQTEEMLDYCQTEKDEERNTALYITVIAYLSSCFVVWIFDKVRK